MEPDIISNNAKLLLVFMISECDCAGVWYVDYQSVRRFFGFQFKHSWIERVLENYIEFLDDRRILIPDYLRHEYGAKLKSLDNTKYNPLNPLRKAIAGHGLKFDFQSQRLIATFNIEPILDYAR